MSEKENFTAQEACVLLGIGPPTFRRLLQEFSAAVSTRREDGLLLVPRGDVARLRRILLLRGRGLAKEEILSALPEQEVEERPPGLGEDGSVLEEQAEPTVPVANGAMREIADHLEHLAVGIGRQEERRLEERDRILTTLLRTQQEIQQLRRELAVAIPRRARHRKSLWARIFGKS